MFSKHYKYQCIFMFSSNSKSVTPNTFFNIFLRSRVRLRLRPIFFNKKWVFRHKNHFYDKILERSLKTGIYSILRKIIKYGEGNWSNNILIIYKLFPYSWIIIVDLANGKTIRLALWVLSLTTLLNFCSILFL